MIKQNMALIIVNAKKSWRCILKHKINIVITCVTLCSVLLLAACGNQNDYKKGYADGYSDGYADAQKNIGSENGSSVTSIDGEEKMLGEEESDSENASSVTSSDSKEKVSVEEKGDGENESNGIIAMEDAYLVLETSQEAECYDVEIKIRNLTDYDWTSITITVDILDSNGDVMNSFYASSAGVILSGQAAVITTHNYNRFSDLTDEISNIQISKIHVTDENDELEICNLIPPLTYKDFKIKS